MLVSHTHRFVFLKTPKAAGTSVEIFFERFCRSDPQNIAHGTDEKQSDVGIVGARIPVSRRAGRSSYWNHMTARELRDAVKPKIWAQYLKFCPIRNPYDQTVSLFWMRLDKDMRITMALHEPAALRDAFHRWLKKEEAPLNLSRDYWSIDGVMAVDCVLRYETLEADVQMLCQKIDALYAPLGTYKTTIRKSPLPFQAYYDPASADRVRAAYDLEFEEFGYAPDSWVA